MAIAAVILMALVSATAIPAAETALFIESDPLGASVTLDGQSLAGATPLLVRGIPPGRHEIQLGKDGYWPAILAVELESTGVASAALARMDTSILFDGNPRLSLGGADPPDATRLLRLKAGTTALRNTGTGIELLPVFSRQRTLDGVRFALPLFIGLTAVVFARDIRDPRPSPLLLSPELVASTAISGGLVILDLVLERQRRVFQESYRVAVFPAEGSTAVVEALVGLGGKYLARGEFAAALSVFGRTAADNPESARTPYCLFECGRICAITGNFEAAEGYYRRIIDEYPVWALYDRTRKNLADLYLRDAEYGRAIGELDAMVFVDPGLSREDIDAFRAEIAKRL